MRRMLCLCNTYYNIRELFGMAGFIPILNNWLDDKSMMKTVVEDRRSSHCLYDYWCLEWDVHPRWGNKWWSYRRTWRSTEYARTSLLYWTYGTRNKVPPVSFRPSANLYMDACLKLDFILCWLISIKYIPFCGDGFILLLNTLIWDVRAQRLYIDRNQWYSVDCRCDMFVFPKLNNH